MDKFLGILAVILILAMIGDNEEQNRINYTQGFVVVILAITVIRVIKLIL